MLSVDVKVTGKRCPKCGSQFFIARGPLCGLCAMQGSELRPAVRKASWALSQLVYDNFESRVPEDSGKTLMGIVRAGNSLRDVTKIETWGVNSRVNLRPYGPWTRTWHLLELGTRGSGKIVPRVQGTRNRKRRMTTIEDFRFGAVVGNKKRGFGPVAWSTHTGMRARPMLGPAIESSRMLGERIVMDKIGEHIG